MTDLRGLIFDAIGLIGIAMMGTGLWIWSAALSLTVVGGLFLAFALMGARARARASPPMEGSSDE